MVEISGFAKQGEDGAGGRVEEREPQEGSLNGLMLRPASSSLPLSLRSSGLMPKIRQFWPTYAELQLSISFNMV